MIKKLNCVEVVNFKDYIVTMERIKNNVYGVPRYKATIIFKCCPFGGAPVYTFTGHYYSIEQEALFILNEYLKEIKKND